MALHALGFALFFGFIVLISVASVLLIALDGMAFEEPGRVITTQIQKVTASLTTMRMRPVDITEVDEAGGDMSRIDGCCIACGVGRNGCSLSILPNDDGAA